MNFLKDTSKHLCKCGDSREDHFPPGKYSNSKTPKECNKCNCSSYLWRERPNKGDKALLILGFIVEGMMGIGIFSFYSMYQFFQYAETLKLKNISVGELEAWSLLCFVMIAFFLIGGLLASSLITDYFEVRKRITRSIKGEHGK